VARPQPGDALDALGDPNRRAIVESLGERDKSVQEIADELPISRPAVSRHLRLLKDAGLVADRADGTRRIYSLSGVGVQAATAYFAQVWGEAAARFTLVAENLDSAPAEHPER
jgi:DNA-binding transcriptional ArsR family regulator